jgi:peptidyl-prolyl cis-trans isomerase SurA
LKIPILLFLATPALVAQTTIEEILVVVNNHIITRKGFQQALEQQHAELYRTFSGKELDAKLTDAREKTLQEMIDTFVLIDVAAEKEMLVFAPTEAEFLDDLKKRAQISSDAELERAVKSEVGVSLSEFIRMQRQSYIVGMLLQQEVYRKVPIEDQEARLYYNENQADYKSTARFRIREMIIPKGATQSDRESARDTLAKVQGRIASGESFESLVNDYSSSPSKGTGGDLGWIDKGMLLPSIENAALGLRPDGVSDPIETDKDYILIQLIALESEGFKPFSAVKDEIVQKLQEPKAENAKEHYLQAQRLRANIRYMVPKDKIIKG